MSLLFSPQLIEILEQSVWLLLALTLKMNVLMLMHFPVHMGVSVRVNVRVDFGVDFRGDCRSPLAEQELLLLSQVLLVVHGAHAVFLRAGRAGGESRAAPLPLSIRQPVVRALQYLCGRRGRSARRGAVFPALAEPQQHRAKDEHYSGGNADDDGPGEGAGRWREHGRDGRLRVCEKKEREREGRPN